MSKLRLFRWSFRSYFVVATYVLTLKTALAGRSHYCDVLTRTLRPSREPQRGRDYWRRAEKKRNEIRRKVSAPFYRFLFSYFTEDQESVREGRRTASLFHDLPAEECHCLKTEEWAPRASSRKNRNCIRLHYEEEQRCAFFDDEKTSFTPEKDRHRELEGRRRGVRTT